MNKDYSEFRSLLEKEGFYLYQIDSNKPDLKNKVSFGKVIKYWYKGDDRIVLLKTGLKKDIVFNLGTYNSQDFLKNSYLQSCLENNYVPFYYSSKELERRLLGIVGYDFSNYGKLKEIDKLGVAKPLFGFQNSSENKFDFNWLESNRDKLLLKGKVSKIVSGGFIVTIGDCNYFIPNGESLRFYMPNIDRKLYDENVYKVLSYFFNLEQTFSRLSFNDFEKLDKETILKLSLSLNLMLVNIREILNQIINQKRGILLIWVYMYYYVLNSINIYNKLLKVNSLLEKDSKLKTDLFMKINKLNNEQLLNNKLLKTNIYINNIFKHLKNNVSDSKLVFVNLFNKVLLTMLSNKNNETFNDLIFNWDFNYSGRNKDIYKGLVSVEIQKLINYKYKWSIASRRRVAFIGSNLEDITGVSLNDNKLVKGNTDTKELENQMYYLDNKGFKDIKKEKVYLKIK